MSFLDSILAIKPGAKLPLRVEEIHLPGDLETPVSAYLKLKSVGARFLLESAEDPTSIGRYSFIGITPSLLLRIERDKTVVMTGAEQTAIPHGSSTDPFTGIGTILDRCRIDGAASDLPLLGGMVGYVGYEIVEFFEPTLQGLLARAEQPYGLFYFVDTLLVFDHFSRSLRLVQLNAGSSEDSSNSPQIPLETIRHALMMPLPDAKPFARRNGNGGRTSVDQNGYERMVASGKRHIGYGDIFQVVLSQHLEQESSVDGFEIYRALRMVNPSPYMFYLDFGDIELIGSSPEAMVKLRGDQAIIRPIAGTRPRGQTADDDARLAAELSRDEKECAEHVMLVDLARNDLGRVCRFGSIETPQFMQLEQYSHVMHLTSTVTGRLRSGCTSLDLFRSAFPAGTVSGAPKLRAMEIIADLERSVRGPYAGAVGYLSLSGDLDMCITIRTIVKRSSLLRLQAGAGIVADSVPEREYMETWNKMAALREAIRRAEERWS
ncbi:MAG: anthranilate synthase component I [Candidatus Zixiibacteriota bacterium]